MGGSGIKHKGHTEEEIGLPVVEVFLLGYCNQMSSLETIEVTSFVTLPNLKLGAMKINHHFGAWAMHFFKNYPILES